MFRFHLGRIPVEVHLSHLLFSALLAFAFKPTQVTESWPNRILGDPHHPEYAWTLAVFIGAWMALIFLSVLVHELGHAVVSLAYGYRPSVQLAWMGGHTDPNPNETIPWNKDVLLTLAGPLFGFCFGLLGLGAWFWLRESAEPANYFLMGLYTANFSWTVLNLIPVPPLDGGRISTALLMRIFGRRGFLFAQVLAVLVSGAAMAYFAMRGVEDALFVLIMFGLFASRAFSLIGAYARGEAPHQGPVHPAEVGVQRALTVFRSGNLEEARQMAEPLLELEPSVRTRNRLHHLLGWIAVKEGEGRQALDHFSQVQGPSVEPQALAAAFSLINDDARALNLWELAYRETRDATVLHEWAGTLLRLDRRSELNRLPAAVDSAKALACAERVCFLRGDFQRAAAYGLEALELEPTAERAYDIACSLARSGDKDGAVSMLRRAEALGFKDVEYARSDADLVSLQGHRGFHEWVLERDKKMLH